MGNSNNAECSIEKGEGYRIIRIGENSPFAGKVEEFFDFIIQVIPSERQKSPADILDKLAPSPSSLIPKSPLQILSDNAGKEIKAKIVSTKYRNVRLIEVDLKQEEGAGKEVAGLELRKERFDQVFETYFPITDMKNNSPVKKAGIRQGQFLIGCLEYPYKTIDAFMEGLYQRFFDKEILDKRVHLVVYDIVTDNLAAKEVVLRRGWGGKGLLGCEFLQGMLNKFPSNLEEQRREFKQRHGKKRQVQQLKNGLGICDGASKSLIESLESQKNKKTKHFKHLKNLLNIQPPGLSVLVHPKIQHGAASSREVEQGWARVEVGANPEQTRRIDELELRVSGLEHTLTSVREYLSRAEGGEEGVQNDKQ